MRESYLKLFLKVSCLILFGLATSCAYRLGSPDRSLPGGYRQVYIPIFKNKSMEPGIEVAFTNALIQEYERSKIARVTDTHQAEVVAEGVIESVTVTRTGTDMVAEERPDMPLGTVLGTKYDVQIEIQVVLKRNSDKAVLWANRFNRVRTFTAAQVTTAGVNTVNPLYNQAAKRQNIEAMAFEMMSEAHDRSTENF